MLNPNFPPLRKRRRIKMTFWSRFTICGILFKERLNYHCVTGFKRSCHGMIRHTYVQPRLRTALVPSPLQLPSLIWIHRKAKVVSFFSGFWSWINWERKKDELGLDIRRLWMTRDVIVSYPTKNASCAAEDESCRDDAVWFLGGRPDDDDRHGG